MTPAYGKDKQKSNDHRQAMTKPRICIFTETYYPVVGGGETQARLLAESLVREGFSVIILTRRSDASLARVERFGEVTVYRLMPVGRGQFKKWGLMLSCLPHLILLRNHYDLIFVSGFRIVGVSAVLVGLILGKAIVLKADSQGEMSGQFFANGLAKFRLSPSSLPFSWFLWLRNRILKRANAFASITADLSAELLATGIDPSVIHNIPNSVDTARFCPVTPKQKSALRAKLGLPQTDQIVIYTGRLVSYKGLPLLLRVWQEILRKHPGSTLLLVGTGGLDIHNCEADLRAYVHAHALHPHVLFAGSVQNVEEYLQASDVFVLPTEDDAFPSSLVEAMACSLPVVATPVGAIGTIIADRKSGLLVQPGDFQQLFGALDNLLTDAALATQLGRAGWQRVQEHYSTDIVTCQYQELFCLVAQPPGGAAKMSIRSI